MDFFDEDFLLLGGIEVFSRFVIVLIYLKWLHVEGLVFFASEVMFLLVGLFTVAVEVFHCN